MKLSNDRRVRTVGFSLGAAFAAGLIVLVLAGFRGDEYEGRVGLIATPAQDTAFQAGTQPPAQYGEVVSLGLPALSQLARSPSVLKAAAAFVPNAPDPGTLTDRVSVDLVPGSGLARVSVRVGTETMAGALATSLGNAIIEADLLAPVAKLRLLDSQAEIIQLQPDWTLAIGLGLAAAVVAGIAVAALRHVLRPPVTSADSTVRKELADAGCRRPVTVLRGEDPTLVHRISVLQAASTRPVRVVSVGPGLGDRVARLSEALRRSGTSLEVNGKADKAVVVAVLDERRAGPGELTAAVGALPDASALIAVVLA
ncbi:hypothetical protein [Amycolatopsis anabasis]|uniref:hypothetical protein n=1 Tax=Amycolatopsis anabasis TaxID=1840409 RepID=UPI001FE2CEA9|nr:hypothetical protein [Amycolatopsis anabasis]